eukprot:CAMPEP_0177630686 /NCGR_PEP_ID=MMETSP0447-20121125/1344_1 /TAXON_ID=0 /ORGANISM="Stygamoeba regulata, Strain BSH-02190019" /LENGTH=42 /DNA_ID= /DNA_START= /DNA_END= /DNA_ORIENTATION=
MDPGPAICVGAQKSVTTQSDAFELGHGSDAIQRIVERKRKAR